jgi:hypothetical protein
LAKHYSIKNQLLLGKAQSSRINFVLATHQYQETTFFWQSISINNQLSLGKAPVSIINFGLAKHHYQETTFFAKALVQYQESTLVSQSIIVSRINFH